jgi:hypothetical protein
MGAAPTPDGYDVSKRVPVESSDCEITVGFDRHGDHIPRFLVRLHRFDPAGKSPDDRLDRRHVPGGSWQTIGQFDHNEIDDSGHDIYEEGLYLDVYVPDGTKLKLWPTIGGLDPNTGAVIRQCVNYLRREVDYFLDVSSGSVSPTTPPRWPGDDSE